LRKKRDDIPPLTEHRPTSTIDIANREREPMYVMEKATKNKNQSITVE
jgi:hypothetical protein